MRFCSAAAQNIKCAIMLRVGILLGSYTLYHWILSLSLLINLPAHRKTSSLTTASHKMVFYFEIHQLCSSRVVTTPSLRLIEIWLQIRGCGSSKNSWKKGTPHIRVCLQTMKHRLWRKYAAECRLDTDRLFTISYRWFVYKTKTQTLNIYSSVFYLIYNFGHIKSETYFLRSIYQSLILAIFPLFNQRSSLTHLLQLEPKHTRTSFEGKTYLWS